jgi:CelD/BcsL family acetyltransferase involved in cellulose biosynthesis
MLRGRLLEEVGATEEVREGWDALAVAAGRPFCAPAWMLSWCNHVGPARAKLRVVAVFDGSELVGLAPFFSSRTRGGLVQFRLLGSRTSVRLEPLAVEGRESEVASVVAATLSEASPRPDLIVFEGIPTRSPWPGLFVEAMGSRGKPFKHRAFPTIAPTLELEGRTYEEWFSSKPQHFRQEARRRRRRLEEKGADFQLCESNEEAEKGLEAFFRLHHARWRERGGSGVLDARVEAMLRDVAGELVKKGRFRIWTISVGDEIISSQVFIAAGGEVAYWLGGFDESWAKLGPSIQTVLKALEHSWAVGDKRLDLGAGAQEYKYSFAESQDVLEWVTLAPRAPRYPITRLQLIPKHMRERVARRLKPETRARLRETLYRRR